MADEHGGHGDPGHGPVAQPAPKAAGSGDKNADAYEDFVIKPGIAVGLGYLAYKYLGLLGSIVGPGFVAGAAAEKLAKDGNININSNQILENMVTGTAMSGAAAWGLNAAKNVALGGTAATGAALGIAASLVAPLIYFPLSYAISNGKLDGIGKDIKNNYLKGLRTIPISLLGAGAAYAGVFAMAPYIAIPAALYLMAGYRTALSRENWSYTKAVGMSFAAPVAAAGVLGYYLIGGTIKAGYQLVKNGLLQLYSKGLKVYEGAKDMFDSFGKIAAQPIGKPVPRVARASAPASAAAGGH